MARRGRRGDAENGVPVAEANTGSTLQLIHDKEVEIEGRMAAVREEAQALVEKARARAAEIIAKADLDAEHAVREREHAMLEKAETEAAVIEQDAEARIAAMRERAGWRHERTVEAVVATVMDRQPASHA